MADSVHHSRLLCWHSVRKQDVFDVARQKHQKYIMTNSSSWRWSMFAVTFMFTFFFLTKALSIGGSCDQDYVHQDVSLMNRRWCWRLDWTRKRRFQVWYQYWQKLSIEPSISWLFHSWEFCLMSYSADDITHMLLNLQGCLELNVFCLIPWVTLKRVHLSGFRQPAFVGARSCPTSDVWTDRPFIAACIVLVGLFLLIIWIIISPFSHMLKIDKESKWLAILRVELVNPELWFPVTVIGCQLL